MRPLQAGTAEEANDESLIDRITDGDHQAFATLVKRHTGRFYAHAWRLTSNAALSEDIVQDCFLKLWRDPFLYDPSRGAKFMTWFYRVVTNAVLDSKRKNSKVWGGDPDTVFAQIETGDAPADQMMIENGRQIALEKAMQELPERQRAALSLCFYEAMSNAEAAEILGVGVKALESLIMRAKQGLKDAMTREGWLDADADGEKIPAPDGIKLAIKENGP